MIVDVVCYNGEPIVERRLRYLAPVVDLFVIVEAVDTFSGKRKDQLYYHANAKVFEPHADKIAFVRVDEFPTGLVPTEGPWLKERNREAFAREKYQRDAALGMLRDLARSTTFLACVCDVDEIPRREVLTALATCELSDAVHLDMLVMCYGTEYVDRVQWSKPFVVPSHLLGSMTSLDLERNRGNTLVALNAGYHMTYFMDSRDVRRKIESFSHTELDTDDFKSGLETHRSAGSNILGVPLHPTPPEILESLPPELRHRS